MHNENEVQQAVKHTLLDRRSRRRWVAVFLILATLVSMTTVALLTERSLALSKPDRIFCCPYAQHVHGPSCYDENGRLCCQYAVSHIHDESCYNREGELICTLPEILPHTHNGSCYEKQTALICTIPESDGHHHSENCYQYVRGELICDNTDEDHVHGEDCYAWTEVLACGQEESEGHHHTEECYDSFLVQTCTIDSLPLHVHSDACFMEVRDEETTEGETLEETEVPTESVPEETEVLMGDPTADVETAAIWERTMAGLQFSGKWREDLLTVAESQIGYRESTLNYEMINGVKKGYTRYGAWYGDPYGDWCAMFICFCLHYAGIPSDAMPRSAGCGRWIEQLTDLDLYYPVLAGAEDAYAPESGDLVFIRYTGHTGVDHVGIVSGIDEETGRITTVEGNSDNRVQSVHYDPDDPRVIGFARLPEQQTVMQQRYLASDGCVYTVILTCGPEAGIPADAALVISEPDAAEYAAYLAQTAEALNCEQKALVELRLLDICIMRDGVEIQPLAPVSVTIRPEDMEPQEDTQVVHFGEDEPEVVDVETVDGEIRFETDGFSVYAIVGSTIEQSILASDGKNYRITVNYDSTAGIPDDATLSVLEITEASRLYQNYVSMSETALGWDEGTVSILRLFDIKILDRNGQKIEIAAPVDVKISLADSDVTSDTQVIHFADGARSGSVVEHVAVDGETLSFAADGFSAYAIVEGPDTIPIGWNRVSSLQELAARGSGGLYISQVLGYYATNTQYTISNSRTGIRKTKPKQDYPSSSAALYYFELEPGTEDQFRFYCLESGARKYVRQNSNSVSFTTSDNATVFTVESFNGLEDTFRIRGGNSFCFNMQGGENGNGFAAYDNVNDTNAKLYFWYYAIPDEDPFGLDSRSYGLMNFTDGLFGKALMASELDEANLAAMSLTVLSRWDDRGDRIFTPKDSEITKWTFHWVEGDRYSLSANVDGSIQYLKIENQALTLSDTPVPLKVVAGTGSHTGEICLLSEDGVALTYSGQIETGFGVSGIVGSEWLHLVADAELTEDYYLTYSADKVSVSDPEITNGSHIIVYTRFWNETKKRYEFYAIDHDGTVVPVYESGNAIQWVGNRINSLLWDFVEYYWEGTNNPNFYYELYNEYSQKYIAPQVTGGQVLSDNTIGINMNGRRNGKYYSDILAWDDGFYAYAGLKVENGRIVSCPKAEADDFYFAVLQDLPTDDSLTTVKTVDNNLYGITMKMVDFSQIASNYRPDNCTTSEIQHQVLGNSHFNGYVPVSGLLSTNLQANGYPTATLTNASLAQLFGGGQTVNHLFIDSILNATGYFEFNSTQNYAYLNGSNFRVYQELGSTDKSVKQTLQHGQFFPYNDLTPGLFTKTNQYNLYTISSDPLPDTDPRKNEQLYLIENPDYYFGMELEASFVQTPSGRDNWGHDIIYEFTGDDDFWLYVDGELIIDLGGIHSALPGSVNYCTGEISVNGVRSTLYDTFKSNYQTRNPGATAEEVNAWLNGIFEQNERGQWVFKDYTSHTMKIFYMERGAGASNLHMRFNLASVKEGTVQLSKKLSGADATETLQVDFPYQIWYKRQNAESVTEHRLNNADPLNIAVVYKDTTTPVPYRETLTIGGVEYHDVFLLKPGEVAEICFPDETISYNIIECGVNTDVYCGVSANDQALTGKTLQASQDEMTLIEPAEGTTHLCYDIGFDTTKNRPCVVYDNTIDPDAIRSMTITKKLYDVTGENELHNTGATFSLRLYLGAEFDTSLSAANMRTYHVKNEAGEYCRWDAASQGFVSLGAGKTDYTALTPAEQASASFATSMNGSISKIPAFYTVEVRELLVGSQFKVEERDYEIPDGYSRLKYVLDGTDSDAPAQGVIPSDANPHVDVCNLKGYGLRIYKEWSDDAFMDLHDETFYGIFIGASDTPVEGSVRRLAPDVAPRTLYWYFDRLQSGTTFADYHIREVILTNPAVGADGVTVTGYSTVQKCMDGASIQLLGRYIGDDDPDTFTYTVNYTEHMIEDSNVRVSTITNARPGLKLLKRDGAGNVVSGATFVIRRGEQEIGTFTSDENGEITVAYLHEGVDYTLTETSAPQNCYGLQDTVTLRLNSDHTVTVTGLDGAYYTFSPEDGTTEAALTFKNKNRTLQFIKIDSDNNLPMEGVHFELHRAVTVGGVTTMDWNPMTGYEDLITTSTGVIPGLDNTLPAGSYYLKEIETLSGFDLLDGYFRFTVDELGVVRIVDAAQADWMETVETNSNVTYTVTVPNAHSRVHVILKKVGYDNTHPERGEYAVTGAVFTIYEEDRQTPLTLQGVPQENITDGGDGIFFDASLLPGTYYVEEVSPPPGYRELFGLLKLTVESNGTVRLQKTTPSGDPTASAGSITGNAQSGFTLTVRNASGYELPATGGRGTVPLYFVGGLLAALALLLLIRRRQTEAQM